MTDMLARQERSERMSRIRGKDATSEMRLRRLIHGTGYRLHVKALPGTRGPCFSCKEGRDFHARLLLAPTPELPDGWDAEVEDRFLARKLEANRRRDEENTIQLNELSWRVLVIWECQIKKDLNDVSNMVRRFPADGTGGDHDEIG